MSHVRLGFGSLLAVVAAMLFLDAPGSALPGRSVGPDVIVGDIPAVMRFGTLNNFTSFSIATTSCNVGDARLDWLASPGSATHPVITQNLYRVANGQIEHIGMSWLKHGFSVAAGNVCGTCTEPGSNFLGVNCSDPYSASLNGSQGGLGPRSEVNASTGVFPVPFSTLPLSRNILDGRIKVANAMLNPAGNAGAKYFVESQYVHPQDASAGNGLNNASYREVMVEVRNGGEFHLKFPSGSSTMRERTALEAWATVHSDVDVRFVDVPNDGRFLVGVKATPIAGGRFSVAVAVQNLNSHRSARMLQLSFPSGTPTALTFHDIDYQHEPYSSTDWTATANPGIAEWATETFAANANANALRWGTLYSYSCEADRKPTSLKVGLFRSGGAGDPSDMTVDLTMNTPLVAERNGPAEEWITVPSSVDVGSLAAGRSFEVDTTCRSTADVIKEIKSSSSLVTAQMEPYEQEKTSTKIRLTPAQAAASGYFESILTLKSKNESEPPIQIRVFGELTK